MFSFFKKNKKQKPEVQEKFYKEDFHNIESIAEYIHRETGITFEKQVISFCRQRAIYSFETLLQDIKNTPELKQELIDHLTTNETYFNREFSQIEELVSFVQAKSQKIEILCAPCATGEEVYSIAIALLEAGVQANHFHIVGIDISQEALNAANSAIYEQRHIRNLSHQTVSKYFTKEGAFYILNTELKTVVSFKLANIFDAEFRTLGKFDFVFSRNMLIYFDKETKLKAKAILESVRKEDAPEVFFGHADLF